MDFFKKSSEQNRLVPSAAVKEIDWFKFFFDEL